MNAHNTGWLKTGAEAKALSAKELHKTTGVPPKGQVDTPETLAALPVWKRASTTLAAKHVYMCGAAVLDKQLQEDAPVLQGFMFILKEMNWHKRGYVFRFLYDVLLWNLMSTSGRFDDALGRFERWGVKSVEAWASFHTTKAKAGGEKPMVSERTFDRVKKRLAALGLIVAESHLCRDPGTGQFVTALWIKPTDELCRIVSEPGYWETVRSKYAYTRMKGKPRGVHAIPKDGSSVA